MLREYHAAMGALIVEHGGTLEHFAGDGMMVFFNDPVLAGGPRRARRAHGRGDARRVRRALAAVGASAATSSASASASRPATPRSGRIGFEGRYDYGMVGMAVIIASRLSSAAAEANQILLNPRAHAAVDDTRDVEGVGELS